MMHEMAECWINQVYWIYIFQNQSVAGYILVAVKVSAFSRQRIGARTETSRVAESHADARPHENGMDRGIARGLHDCAAGLSNMALQSGS
ncbi:hypothetical protein [Sphingobium lignivorans]|uniref:Uncharacterized protein n=1 Tax=Sphingobium lignivorans TaxID=2735886 RepID=A0ABR6NE08_9SPHN|nr:hypothetical protein [Sphingobium lignivorans]MBB5985520.1 hypothetical protein [Sphingobium lignivorans]